MSICRKEIPYGNSTLVLETGKIAKQAYSIMASNGESQFLVTAARSGKPIDRDFLPLSVEYQEKQYAAGKIPGGYFRREARPRPDEILIARIIDRTCRPLFPKDWRYEVQVISTVIGYDGEYEADAASLTAASAALAISDIPWGDESPVAGVRVARVNGEFIINPTFTQRGIADIDMMVGCSDSAIVMVEGGANEAAEADVIEALYLAFDAAQPMITAIREMAAEVGSTKIEFVDKDLDQELLALVEKTAISHGLADALQVPVKLDRYAQIAVVKQAVKDELFADEALAARSDEVSTCFGEVKHHMMRGSVLETKKRIGGRAYDEIRAIDTEVDVLGRTHGSSMFQRGETQALVAVTLGTGRDAQRVESLNGMEDRTFMLHYNFPPFCVGETGRIGPNRRQHGHGALARRALAPLVPSQEEFPYVVRVVSEITESNGSSSMASVCGGSMAMMAAGVPMAKPVAGIAMGMIKEGDDYAILSDILGDEDHLGDMDFKICGTRDGITAIQMDIKIKGLARELLTEAVEQARAGRLHILGEMAKTLDAAREELSPYAPRIDIIEIPADKIRDIIGPGGKKIRELQEASGCTINVDEDHSRGVGIVHVMSSDGAARAIARELIEELTAVPEEGKVYAGNIAKITDFGAFVRIMPGIDGLLHVSEMAYSRVEHPSDLFEEGDEVEVKVLEVDERSGKVRLSRRPLLEKPEGWDEEQERRRKERAERGDRGRGRGDRGRGRGDRGRGRRDGGRERRPS
ncbi:MAG TPA: polyribonucleotide nucleotidyltransferase [Myxococcales bacterium]|nr:polyribonucleotide nucleotidyltransferase [Myxococcales bacterium]MBF94726.1 polyribonucleotide nucleotidyltransferase [Myxococcales bacterium]HBU49131.1 polyribonucleotide nucleotidyltransferase [Myxococcales bacterium]